MYGLRLEQVFKPKYFIIGLALDATIEHNTANLTGNTSKTIKRNYDSTKNYTLVSPSYLFEAERLVTTEYPDYSKGTMEIKEIKSTISIPVGFEFELAKYIKLRTGYTYKQINTYTKTVTSTTNNPKRKITTDYADPSIPDTVVYDSNPLDTYEEDTSTEIESEKYISNIFSAGFEIILSQQASFNIGGSYDINNKEGLIIVDTKFRF